MRTIRSGPWRNVAAVCAALLVLAGLCGCGSSGAGKANPNVAEHAPPVRVVGDGFAVSVDAEPNRVIKGITVDITLSVTNLSGADRTFQLRTGQEYEFKAFSTSGAEVWRWSTGQFFTQAITPVTIKSTGNLSFKASWPTKGQPAGVYRLMGYFLGLPELQPTDTVVIQ